MPRKAWQCRLSRLLPVGPRPQTLAACQVLLIPSSPDHTLRAKCNSIGSMSFCSTPPTLGPVCTAPLGIPCYTQQTGQAVLPRAVLRTSLGILVWELRNLPICLSSLLGSWTHACFSGKMFSAGPTDRQMETLHHLHSASASS